MYQGNIFSNIFTCKIHDRINDKVDIPHRNDGRGAILLKVGEVLGRGEIQLLSYSLNSVSGLILSLHFTQLLRFSVNMMLKEHC